MDLRYPLTDATRAEIKSAILDYKVVFFRDQDLDRDQHAAFARQFGPLYSHPSTTKTYADKVPAIHQISAAEASKHAQLTEKIQAEGWDPYHSDTSWRLVPTWGRRAARGDPARRRRRHDLGRRRPGLRRAAG